MVMDSTRGWPSVAIGEEGQGMEFNTQLTLCRPGPGGYFEMNRVGLSFDIT